MEIKIGEKTYTLKQDAFRYNDTEYHAAAASEFGDDVTIVWGIAQEWAEAEAEYAANDHQDCPAILEDESNALDWDNMSIVE